MYGHDSIFDAIARSIDRWSENSYTRTFYDPDAQATIEKCGDGVQIIIGSGENRATLTLNRVAARRLVADVVKALAK